MKVGTVVGTVVSTVNIPVLDGHRLLLCDIQDADGKPDGYTICIDVVDAGVGETVLILDEGSSARQILGIDTGAIRAVIVGVVDELHVDGELREVG
ncbi:MAG TPA: EutN/CcmL family microcompartment protein [Acidimicrobiia bacterium]|nr:EutN/CcmL family microcompartment protein [Acidimicrobiia bacterium]